MEQDQVFKGGNLSSSVVRFGNLHIKRRQEHVNSAVLFIAAVKAADHVSIATGDVIAVVTEGFARIEARRFAHNFVTFDDHLFAIDLLDNPFTTKQFDHEIRPIVNRDEVDKRMRHPLRQIRSAAMIHETVETGG
jgi:hypothetical protein